MTRPRVDPEKRQRTANACDSCKRRKQKCDGEEPCATCIKKQFTCVYSNNEHLHNGHDDSQPPAKRHHKEPNVAAAVEGERNFAGASVACRNTTVPDRHRSNTPTSSAPLSVGNAVSHRTENVPQAGPQSESSASGGEEEADNHTMTRMLEDGSGRLIYIGDAATISFLQLLRMIVETMAGPSPFTMDPARHHIIETKFTLLPDVRRPHLLPEKCTALVLVDSFFVNTHGLIQAFEEGSFLQMVERCYSDPLTVEPTDICHLNLVFAIGLALATPKEGSFDAKVIEAMRANYPDQSEVFYYNAKGLSNPIVGFEDADFWSIQALLLMGVYMLTRSKRNTAFAYIGMAVRSAYMLGMHREETLAVFSEKEQTVRKMVWRSLFVMDRFLAASLGRPVAIAEDECSGEILAPFENEFRTASELAQSQLCTAGLEAVVRSSHVVGIILKKVYLKRKVAINLAQELANECKTWPENLCPALHWRRASPDNHRQAIAILHSNIVYCHSVILLTRPFFLYLLSAEIQGSQLGTTQMSEKHRGRTVKFSNACLIASQHTVAIVQRAYEGRYLPRLNTWANYCLLAAALVIFANEFARPSSDKLLHQCMENSITIMSFCGETDPQAQRATHVLVSFRNAILEQRSKSEFRNQPPAFETLLSMPTPKLNGDAPFTPSALASTQTSSMPEATAPSTAINMPAAMTPYVNPFDTSTFAVPSLPYEDSFSGLLDLSNTVLPTGSDPESSGNDEPIEFDSLWQWPGFNGGANAWEF